MKWLKRERPHLGPSLEVPPLLPEGRDVGHDLVPPAAAAADTVRGDRDLRLRRHCTLPGTRFKCEIISQRNQLKWKFEGNNDF